MDIAGFNAEMDKQRTRARASWKGADRTQINPVYQTLPKTEFLGRETLEAEARVLAVLDDEIVSGSYAVLRRSGRDRWAIVRAHFEGNRSHRSGEHRVAPAPGITAHRLPGPGGLKQATS